MKKLTDNFTSDLYVRVFISPDKSIDFINNYIKNFDAKVEYIFEMPKLNNLLVIALTSPFGNISLVVTESLEGFPEYLGRTKILYWTKDIAKTLREATEHGMTVLQEKTAVPIGYQGRFETPGGYVVEFAELNEEGKQYFSPDLESYGIK